MGRAAVVLSSFLVLSSSSGLACSSLLGDFSVDSQAADGGVSVRADAGAVGAAEQGDAGVAPTVHAVVTASATSVYTGQAVSLDASKSAVTGAAVSYAWSVVMAPAGSSVTTASLASRTSAVTSFVPDVAGHYALHLQVQAGTARDTKDPAVDAYSPQIFFAQGTSGARAPGGVDSLVYTAVGLDGTGAHAVLCSDLTGFAQGQGPALALASGRAYDSWDAPPGPQQASRFAAFTLDSADDGGAPSAHLWAGTSASTCGAPLSLSDFGDGRFGPGRPFGSSPHFSPDGTRFVVYDDHWRILTFASDEPTTPPHVVGDYSVTPSVGASALDPVGVASNAYVTEPPRVVWTATGLAWAQPTNVGWEVVTAADMTGAPLSTYMTCTGVTPREIAVLSDGTVLASYRQSSTGSENLFQLKPDAQRNCTHEEQYTHLASTTSAVATDFDVSPDGTQIAFVALDPTTQDATPWMVGGSQLPGGYLYVVPVAGGKPAQVTREPALYGPRWTANGAGVVFTRLDGVATNTGRAATSVVFIAPDGTGERVLAQGDGVSTFVGTSGNAACDVATPGRLAGGGAAAGGAAALVLAAGLRRRGRRAATKTGAGRVVRRP